MYQLLEGKSAINKAQRLLEATLRREFTERETKDIGWPSDRRVGARVFGNGRFWYWTTRHDEGSKSARYLNWFGLYNSRPGVGISAEINTPLTGRNGRLAGFFARDTSSGRTYLFHSGGVGGGAKGVGRTRFLAWSNNELQEVVDSGGGVRHGVRVMPVDGLDATRSAIAYLENVVEFKQAVRDGRTSNPSVLQREKELRAYIKESTGRRKWLRRTRVIDYVSRHGDVVDALKAWRESRPLHRNSEVTNTRLIDLGVHANAKFSEVYEVKTSAGRTDVYTAIGQLAVHASVPGCQRVICLPADDELLPELRGALSRLGIGLLLYRIRKTSVSILD